MKSIFKQTVLLCVSVPVLFSCATYNNSMSGYYNNLKAQNYSAAQRSIEHNKLIKKDRNALLYNLEMGKIHRLQNDPAKSNFFLNRADAISESNRKSFKDMALGNLLNPMHQAYRCEDYEKFMMHYYKALNYAALGQTEDAVVEARRISLTNNTQSDKFRNKDNRYSNDAFALNLQGMIYEMAGNMNDAFISYRNAANIYLKSGNEYYGVKMPPQLVKDLLRTATTMGFTGERIQYEKIFSAAYTEKNIEGGELILFIEEGQAPVKEEKNFILTAGPHGIGSFYYTDANGNNVDFNFDHNAFNIGEDKLTSVKTFRLALPEYRIQSAHVQSLNVSLNGTSFTPQLGQNINSVAVNILKERFVSEMANALARQLTKKLAEKGTNAAAESFAKSTDKKEDKDADEAEKEKQKKKKEERANQAGEVAGFLMNVVNTATEKADTRNWQSLPAFVSYVRIPLNAGENNITVTANGNTIAVKAIGGKGLQMMSTVCNEK